MPLVALALVLLALVGLGLTGSSTGILNESFNSRSDPNQIVGDPQPIRSDEWYVQTSWTISQVEQGLPVRNDAFPGGMDATVQHDLPSSDWSTAFRPHLVGFWFLPLDNAMALKWWLPGFALIAATYLLAVTMMPRRPVSSMALAVGFFFAPFFQWWYLSITFWAPAWAFLLMAGVIWILRSTSRAPRIVFPLLIGYVSCTVGMGIYVPFIVPATFVALAFCVGFVLTRSSNPVSGVWRRLVRLKGVFAAGAVAAGILALWLGTRWDTITGFTETVYPGERLQEVGTAGRAELRTLFAGPLSEQLSAAQGIPLAGNASEAATFLLPGIFLAIPLVWMAVNRYRFARSVDWLTVSLLLLGMLWLAYFFLPGWDAIAHLLLLDRTTLGRARMALGMLSLVLVLVTAVRLDESTDSRSPVPLPVKIVTIALAAALNGAIVFTLYRAGAQLFSVALVPILVLFLVVVWATMSRAVPLAAISFLVMSIIAGSGVNPLYAGVYDLNSTSLVRTMKQIDSAAPGTWVGVGDTALPTVTLVQSGLPSFNGFQSSPSEEMWAQIDPEGDAEKVWNRLANVSWRDGEGEPDPINPAPDQIRLVFDSCHDFAQDNVTYVLSDVPLNQPCLEKLEDVQQGPTSFDIYQVN